jgi:hypothetical protein
MLDPLPKEEENMRKLLVSALIAGTALIGAAGAASASDVRFGLSIGVPAPRPVYVPPPPPVYYYPPAYYAPAPVIVAPAPRYAYPAYPVYYPHWRGRHWHRD